MDVQELRTKSGEFKQLEGRASFYDLAVQIADDRPLHAAVIILATWNVGRFRFFASDSQNLIALDSALKQTAGAFSELGSERFEIADFERLRSPITAIYDSFSGVKGVEYTGASKVMHLLKRDLFVMCDRYIRREFGLDSDSSSYMEFLEETQKKFAGIRWDDPGKTLPKATDEYNYVTISLPALEREGRKRIKRD